MENMIVATPYIALIISLIALLVNAYASEKSAKTATLVAQKQIDNALAVARLQIVSPIRQKWIDNLRGHVATLISTAQAHWIYPTDVQSVHTNMLRVARDIELMLNPNESDHQELKAALNRLIEVVILPKEQRTLRDFTDALVRATSLAQSVSKREWERVKNEK